MWFRLSEFPESDRRGQRLVEHGFEEATAVGLSVGHFFRLRTEVITKKEKEPYASKIRPTS